MVQSRGMEQWLRHFIASRKGIEANTLFPFPRNFLDLISSLVDEEYSPGKKISRQELSWFLFLNLEDFLKEIKQEELARYASRGAEQRFQLSRDLADMYDQYLIYRFYMLDDWTKDNQSKWQGQLWSLMQKKFNEKKRFHQLDQRKKIINALNNEHKVNIIKRKLPAEINIFGISALPLFYLDTFYKLSRHIPLHFYLLNPSEKDWSDIFSSKGISYMTIMHEEEDLNEEDLHLFSGNDLLASLGQQGREYFSLLLHFQESSDNRNQGEENYFEDKRGTILSRVKNDILTMINRGSTEQNSSKDDTIILSDNESLQDDSIEIHVHYSPLREIQYIYHYILAQIEKHNYNPEDFLILIPNLEKYRPYILSSFEHTENDLPSLPWFIADKRPAMEQSLIKAFFSVFDVSASRFALNEIFDFFSQEAVLNSFNINLIELKRLFELFRNNNIRWGLNDRHCASFYGQKEEERQDPERNYCTWEKGIGRIILSAAVDKTQWTNVFPASHPDEILPHLEESQPAMKTLSSFLIAFDALQQIQIHLQEIKTLEEWMDIIENFINYFFPFEENEKYKHELKMLNNLIANMRGWHKAWYLSDHSEDRGNDREKVSLVTVIRFLKEQFVDERGNYPFYQGKITFAELLPMRTIPAKIIILAGLNEGEFPRQDKKNPFSLMRNRRKPGDRSLRDEDRYLFLESLVSAQEKILLSYTGRDPRDGSELPPSPVVAEIQDYLQRAFKVATNSDQKSILDFIVVHHPLHRHHYSYFSSNLQSRYLPNYSTTDYFAGKLVFAGQHPEKNEIKTINLKDQMAKLKIGGREKEKDGLNKSDLKFDSEIQLTDIYRFFFNPCRYYTENTVGSELAIYSDNSFIEREEDLFSDNLRNYQLRQEILSNFIDFHQQRNEEAGNSKKDIAKEFSWSEDGLSSIKESLTKRSLARGNFSQLSSATVFIDRTVDEIIAFFHLLVANHIDLPKTLSYQNNVAVNHIKKEFIISKNIFHVNFNLNGENFNPVEIRFKNELSGTDILQFWINHMGVCLSLSKLPQALNNYYEDRFRYLISTQEIIRFPILNQSIAEKELHRLLLYLVEGKLKPIPFFPKSSYAFAFKTAEGDNLSKSIKYALNFWQSNAFRDGESSDRYIKRYYGRELQDIPQFQEFAEGVFTPIIKTMLITPLAK